MVHVLLLTILSTLVPSLPVDTFCRPTLVLILILIVLTFLFHYFLMVMVFTVVFNLYGITIYLSRSSHCFLLHSSCKTRVIIVIILTWLSVCVLCHRAQEIGETAMVTGSVLHWLDLKSRFSYCVRKLCVKSKWTSQLQISTGSTSSRSACSVYLGGTRSHNECRLSTPACYLLPCLTLHELRGRPRRYSACAVCRGFALWFSNKWM